MRDRAGVAAFGFTVAVVASHLGLVVGLVLVLVSVSIAAAFEHAVKK